MINMIVIIVRTNLSWPQEGRQRKPETAQTRNICDEVTILAERARLVQCTCLMYLMITLMQLPTMLARRRPMAV